MLNVNAIGYIASALTALEFVPQAIHIVKTKDTRSISLLSYIIVSISTTLWLIYGFLMHSSPMILTNVTLLVVVFIILKYKFADIYTKFKNAQ
jgi:MtN3 and saliva related transmembrane protein